VAYRQKSALSSRDAGGHVDDHRDVRMQPRQGAPVSTPASSACCIPAVVTEPATKR
jgi:hypothetical protein